MWNRSIGRGRFAGTAALLAVTLAAMTDQTAAEERLPIFDAHVHYSAPDWRVYPPQTIIGKLREAGVIHALVSSTPDDGTLTLYRLDPQRIVPELRPYRYGGDMHDWFANKEVMDYVAARLSDGNYKGIGEFHLLADGNANSAEMARVIKLALDRDVVLHVHSGAGPVKELFAREPKLRVLWAHAGLSEPASVVNEMLDTYPRLWTEVSLRAYSINAGGALDSAWRAVLMRHGDRILIGSDTWVTSRWDQYAQIIDEHRAWLALLPREMAEAIAYKNAMQLFGVAARPSATD